MKYLGLFALALTVVQATPVKRSDPQGTDVSNYQTNINWNAVADKGIQFAYIKATEGISYVSSEFKTQYDGAANVGLIRGAYHFAHPDESSGAVQANHFVDHGDGWTPDGMTLPGVLDIEPNPNANDPMCYGLTPSGMVSWIEDFSNTYHGRTGRYPVIYTITSWWISCTGNSANFGTNPLWIARWASKIGSLPAGWSYPTFWQYDSGSNPGDEDVFNGDSADLKRFATG